MINDCLITKACFLGLNQLKLEVLIYFVSLSFESFKSWFNGSSSVVPVSSFATSLRIFRALSDVTCSIRALPICGSWETMPHKAWTTWFCMDISGRLTSRSATSLKDCQSVGRTFAVATVLSVSLRLILSWRLQLHASQRVGVSNSNETDLQQYQFCYGETDSKNLSVFNKRKSTWLLSFLLLGWFMLPKVVLWLMDAF